MGRPKKKKEDKAANELASRISEKERRDDVFAKLALEIMVEHQDGVVEKPTS